MVKKKSPQSAPVGLLVIGAFLAGAAITYAVVTVFHQQPATPPSNASVSSPPPAAPVPPPPVATPVPGTGYDQLVNSGHTYMDAGQYQSAVNFYTAALAIDSSDANVWVDRGACKHALGDGEGARQDFRRGLELNPTHTIAHFNMGITYFTEGKDDSAKIWFNRVLVLAPGSDHAKKAAEIIARIDSGQ